MDERSRANALQMTRHARARRAQRGIPLDAIEATLDHGREIRAGSGDVFLYLGRNEVDRAARTGLRLGDFEGTTLVVLPNGTLKTLWKAERPPRGIRRRRRPVRRSGRSRR
jgi:hypothetical protein